MAVPCGVPPCGRSPDTGRRVSMISVYKTIEDELISMDKIEEGCWVSVTRPTSEELVRLQEETGIDIDDLRAPLDDEERSRVEIEDHYNMILVDIPSLDEKDRYVTIPLGIFMTKEQIVTVCLEESPVLKAFENKRVREFYTFKKTRFVFQILYRNATSYLRYLRIIDRKSEQIEEKLHISQKNSELIELLEDVIIENKQAIEMANIYSGILSGTMDAFASVISNNLNIVMKFLATVTIVLSIPTMIASFFGMNFDNIPLGHAPYGFYTIIILTLVVSLVVAFFFRKKDLF